MKKGTYSEIAEAVFNGDIVGDNWVGYDPESKKAYYSSVEGENAFDYNYTIEATCQDSQPEEQEEAKGLTKAPVYYDNYFALYAFGSPSEDSDNVGKTLDIKLPECAYDDNSGYYDVFSIKGLEIDGISKDIYVNNEGFFDSYEQVYIQSEVRNVKLTLTEIPQNDPGNRGMTKSADPEPVYGWVLTYDEYDQM